MPSRALRILPKSFYLRGPEKSIIKVLVGKKLWTSSKDRGTNFNIEERRKRRRQQCAIMNLKSLKYPVAVKELISYA